MSIDPQLVDLLVKLNNRPSADTNSLEKAREKFKANRPSESVFEQVAALEDIAIPGNGADVPVRIYRPEGEGDFPVFIYMHGGGFVLGNLDMNDGLLRFIANRAGCVIVSVDYRLAPEHPFPAAIEDSFAVVKWAYEHGSAYRIDPKRIAIGGNSSGGNLAAVAAYLSREENIPIALQVLIYPFIDLSFGNASQQKFATGYNFTTEQAKWYLKQYLGSTGEHDNDPLASPFNIKDLSGLASALVLTAEYDILVDEGGEYAERLKSAGVPVEYICYEGMIHPFLSFWDRLDKGKQAAIKIAESLRQHFYN